MDIESGANEQTKYETYLNYLRDKSKYMSNLHAIDYRFNQAVSNYSIIPLVIITTFTGTATFFFESSIPPDFQKGYLILIGCSNILAGLITIVKELIKIRDMKESKINYVAFPFQKLARDIQMHINCEHDDINETIRFTENCREEYHKLMESAPTASNYARRKLQKITENAMKICKMRFT